MNLLLFCGGAPAAAVDHQQSIPPLQTTTNFRCGQFSAFLLSIDCLSTLALLSFPSSQLALYVFPPRAPAHTQLVIVQHHPPEQNTTLFNMFTASSSSSFLLLLFLSMGIAILGQHRQYSPSRPKSQQAAKSPPSGVANQQQPQFMTAPQCRCKDLNECAREIQKLVDKCKLTPKCEAHLAKIGNAAKIRQCLADEQKDMEKLEDCVEKKTGPIGCTNDPKPKNLTIPIIPEMMEDGGGGSGRSRQGRSVNTDWDFEDPDADIGGGSGPRTLRAAPPPLPATQEEGHAPPELSDYLMCVDQCAVQSASPNSAPKLCATRESNMDCAFRLKCALAPPDERQQKAFDECEKQLQLIPAKRVKKSCECLKSAGVKIVCPK